MASCAGGQAGTAGGGVGSWKPRQVEELDVNKCTCDPRLKVPDSEIDQTTTLLKYTNPFKVVMNIRKGDIKLKPLEIGAKPECALLTDNSPETQEVLDCIQEPRFWTVDGELWTQVVSPGTTKRYEINLLHDELNRKLWMGHARPFGMCRVRYEVFSQLYDELSRQVTVICAERGLFLVRIRAELKYTIRTLHFMWRDIMEYFSPIVEECTLGQAKLQQTVGELEAEIVQIKKEMEEVHWKTVLLEQDRAYARQATLEWYRCKIEEEKLLMQQLATLMTVIGSDDWTNSCEANDIISLNEDSGEKGKHGKICETNKAQALQLSDNLKDLIVERKSAEGRMKTKKLLEDEIIWVKGEISKNKAFLTDLLRLKEPLDFDKWFDAMMEGRGDDTSGKTFIITNKSSAEDNRSPSPEEDPQDARSEDQTRIKMPLMKWLINKDPEVCECRKGMCRQEMCPKLDLELLVRQAMTDYLYDFDDRPTVGFRPYFKKWMRTKDVQTILAVSHFFEESPKRQEAGGAPPPSPTGARPDVRSKQHPSDPDLQQLLESRSTDALVRELAGLCPNPYEISVSPLKLAFMHKGRARTDIQPGFVLLPPPKDTEATLQQKMQISKPERQRFNEGYEKVLSFDPELKRSFFTNVITPRKKNKKNLRKPAL